METPTSDNRTPRPAGFDTVAVEALSAGIGLGNLVSKKKPALRKNRSASTSSTPRRLPKASTVTVPKVRFSRVRSVLAWFCDLLIISGSLLAATGVAHYATTDIFPAPADIVFVFSEHFAAHEIAIAIAALLTGYFILFKLLVGLTLGETIFGLRRR